MRKPKYRRGFSLETSRATRKLLQHPRPLTLISPPPFSLIPARARNPRREKATNRNSRRETLVPAARSHTRLPESRPARMKRKDIDDAYEEFTDFSPSAPARKIRRLDALLPSIVEEEEPVPVPVIPLVFNQQVRDEQLDTSMIEVESTLPSVNDEKALVLYKPMNDRVFSVSSDVISGIMNQYLWPRTPVNADGAQRPPINNCLAMVPWQAPFHAPADTPPEEAMDAEVTEAASMEIEQENSGEAVNTGVSDDSFQQWQQHCMTVELPPSRSSPIMWSGL